MTPTVASRGTILALLAASTTARAQPSQPPEPVPPPELVAMNAFELGTTLGETSAGDLYAGVVLAGGRRLRDMVWAHAAAVTASTPNLSTGFSRPITSDFFTEVRGGLELRACASLDRACGMLGVDVGYRHERFAHTMLRSGGEAVARLGGDIALGRADIRLRAAVEGTSTHAADTTAVTITLAYLW